MYREERLTLTPPHHLALITVCKHRMNDLERTLMHSKFLNSRNFLNEDTFFLLLQMRFYNSVIHFLFIHRLNASRVH